MTTVTTEEVLLVEDLGAIQRLTLNRPGRLNALNQPLSERLLQHFESLRRNRDIRVVILRGAGRAFCSGADLKAAGTPEALQDGPRGDWTLRDLMKAMRGCPQPIIALVRGPAAGGGLALALASDVTVVSESAVFHSAFIKIGLSGAELGVGWRLQRTMGVARAREALLAGRPIDAQTAVASGLASSLTTEEGLDDYGLDLARDMLNAAPDALRLTKRSLDAALEIASPDAAMELEERAQMLMSAQRRADAAR